MISHPRPTNPDPMGGRLRIASLNLENYFNGNGQAVVFPVQEEPDRMASSSCRELRSFRLSLI